MGGGNIEILDWLRFDINELFISLHKSSNRIVKFGF